MKKAFSVIVAVCLVLSLTLSGCSAIRIFEYFQQFGELLGGGELTSFGQMAYTRPDMTQFQQKLDQCCTQATSETDLNDMVQIIYDFYGAYDDFYTNFALAMVYYSKDQTNTYWRDEYQFCTSQGARVDAGLDRFYRVLAQSPLRWSLEGDAYFGSGFFDKYLGKSLYDEHFTTLLNTETDLENQYYDLIAQAGEDFAYTQSFYDTYGVQMAEVFVELIKVRQEQAAYAGYESYPEFAYSFFHARDYTVAQATGYLADIRAELVPLYQKAVQNPGAVLYACTEQQTFDHVKSLAQNMGGQFYEAFTQMEKAGLYDITASENKLDASFEIYIRNYRAPYVFINPNGTEYDKLTFTHEFGHFCRDYVSMGSGTTVDVAEIFSQGMEYLSLCFDPVDDNLVKLKLLDGLCIYVEQAAYASFEQQVYSLEGEALTVENVQALYNQTCSNYGLAGGFTYLFITHFFTEPMYVISYVVSNDAALQLYQLEKAETGAGLTRLSTSLTLNDPYFLAFVQKAGLESPFAPGRIQRVKETLQSVLNG